MIVHFWKHITWVILAMIGISWVSSKDSNLPIIKVPSTKLKTEFIQDSKKDNTGEWVSGFKISEQISLRTYMQFVHAMEKDSGAVFANYLLPDSTIFPKGGLQKYITDSIYENEPIVGISWEQAILFCQWLTQREQTDSVAYYYRLPTCNEWLAAQQHLGKDAIKYGFNSNYSDWTSESLMRVKIQTDQKPRYLNLIQTEFHHQNEYRALTRKIVIGNNYKYQIGLPVKNVFNYYPNRGYGEVSFRVVRVDSLDDLYQAMQQAVVEYFPKKP